MSKKKPVILGFVADLYFVLKIEGAAESLSYQVKWIESVEQVAENSQPVNKRQLAEHLEGPGAELLDYVTKLQPTLIIFDLDNAKIPCREWIALLKSAPATRRIPVLAYGPHVDTQSQRMAYDAGADVVLPRSKLAANLVDLIQEYARLTDFQAIDEACHQRLPELAVKGLEEFNQGEYFEAHETLEEAWNEDRTPAKELYRAVLQVAVAYLQIERGNYNGAMKMFLRMRQWFATLPDQCRGVDLKQLRADADLVHKTIISLGSERMDEFDRSLLKPVTYSQKI